MKLTKGIILAAAITLVADATLAQAPFSLDTTFRTDLVPNLLATSYHVGSILPMEDGRLIISGQFKFADDPLVFEGPTPPFGAVKRHGARLYPDGTRDTTFRQFPAMGGKIIPWNGKMYMTNGGVRRLDLDGNIDTTYKPMYQSPYISTLHSEVNSVNVFPDGRVLVGGQHILSDTARGFSGLHNIIWLTNTGALDTTRIHRKGNGRTNVIRPLADGKFIVACGICTQQEDIPVGKIFRLHADGALDTTFQSPIDWGTAIRISELEDGRLLISGRFKISSLTADTLHIARFLPDGALDPTFNYELDVRRTDWLHQSNVSPSFTRLLNGYIILHGSFTQVAGEQRLGIALLNEDGQLLDEFFGGGCGPYELGDGSVNTGRVNGLVFAPDGSMYIHGAYIGFGPDSTQRLVSRLFPPDFTVATPEVVEPTPTRLRIAPNPASGHVSFTYDEVNATQLVVRDALGRVVHQVALQGSRYSHTWHTGGIRPGIYFVEVQSAGTPIFPVEKLMIE